MDDHRIYSDDQNVDIQQSFMINPMDTSLWMQSKAIQDHIPRHALRAGNRLG